MQIIYINRMVKDAFVKMDNVGRSQELLENVEMVPHMRSDIKISDADAALKGDEDTDPPPELLNTAQFINIHRVSDSLTKTLVDCRSPTPQAMISGELMQHHVVHTGMVVDMMVPTQSVTSDFTQHAALDRASIQHYMPEHYDADDVLLSHELTEEERRLADALVTVQYVQPQKLHHSTVVSESNIIVSTNGLSNLITTAGQLGSKVPVSLSDHHIAAMAPLSPGTGVDKPVTEAMVSNYIQAVEAEAAALAVNNPHAQLLEHPNDRVLKLYQSQVHHQELRLPALPPLKKVLSSQNMTIKNRYVRSHLDIASRLGLQPEQDELDERLHQQTVQHVSKVHSRIPVEDEDELKEEYDIKSEGIDDMLAVESDEVPQDDNDSDYDVESDLRSSRKSLPHKKRIPRKLKNPKKSASPSRSIHAKCYKCNKCGEQFTNQSAYSAHRQTHTAPKKMFHCELCGKGFSNQLKFFEHLKSHYEPSMSSNLDQSSNKSSTKDKISSSDKDTNIKNELDKQTDSSNSTIGAIPSPLTCNLCGKSFRRQKAFETHINIAHPKQEEIEFSEPEDLMAGIRDVVNVGGTDTGDEDDLECLSPQPSGRKGSNEKVWYREEDLHATEADLQEMEEQQRREQHSDSENICELCDEVFENKAQLTEHVSEDHLDIPADPADKEFTDDPGGKDIAKRKVNKRSRRSGLHLVCPECGRTFNHRNSLVYHLRSHSGERPHKCDICNKSFFAASALKVHMRLHSGDKPYKCEFCGRHFRQWGDLKYHCISIHSEEKNYQCEYCGKDFARKYSLIVHRRIHTGEKNYKCEYCSKSFRASSYLQNHRRIHTGEKPHLCEICGKPFRVRSDMKRHLNTHNRDRHRPPGPTTCVVISDTNMLHPTKIEASDSDQLDPHGISSAHTITVEHPPITDLGSVAEITIRPEGGGPESILPDESLDRQPINLNIAVPASGTQAVTEEVLQYARDPLETVRDGNTLYVWPIYMA